MTTVTLTEDDQNHRLRWKQSLAYFATFIVLGLTYAPLGPTLTNLASNTSVALDQISVIFSARGLGYLTGSVVSGRLLDSTKGNPILVGAMTSIAVMLGLTPLIHKLWLLVIVIFFLGTFQGMLEVGCNTMLVWIHGKNVSPFMNALHFFFGVGAFLCPIIVAQVLARSSNVHWAFWTLSLLVLPVVLAMLGLPSPSAPQTPIKNDNVENGDSEPTASRRVPRRQRAQSFILPVIVLFFFMYVGAESGTSGWIATYAKATALGNATVASYLTSVFWIAITAGRLLSIPLAAWVTPKTVLLIDLVGAIASILVPIVAPRSSIAIWVGTIGVGLFMASMFPTMVSFAERKLIVTGRVTSWYLVGGSLGGMTLPWVIGQLFESWGPRAMLYGVSISLILGFITFGVLVLVTKPGETATYDPPYASGVTQ